MNHLDLIGTIEAAEILDMNRVSVWRLVQSGELKPAIIRERGRREILFDREDIVAYRARREYRKLQKAS